MTRVCFLAGFLLCLCLTAVAWGWPWPRLGGVSPSSSISPDGTFIDCQPGGGGTAPGAVGNAYGTWTFGDREAGPPPWGGGAAFCTVLLNGYQTRPKSFFPHVRLMVNFGGRLFSATHDQTWDEWGGYFWLSNGGADFASGPTSTPAYDGLPTFHPPYTASPENTSISGGTGTLTTDAGVFQFGAPATGGYETVINGVTYIATGFSLIANQMTVYGHGQLFMRDPSNNWTVWTGNDFNRSDGPTAGPIPIKVFFPPIGPNPTIPAASTIGTFVTNVAVTMSDGSPFTGTITFVDAMSGFAASGNTIVTTATPVVGNTYRIIVNQNGSDFLCYINVYTN